MAFWWSTMVVIEGGSSAEEDSVTEEGDGASFVRQNYTIRILLHTADGSFPFLTPELLQATFPPSDLLWLAIPVKDTCVVPILKEDGTPKGYSYASSVDIDSWLEPYQRVSVPAYDLLEDTEGRTSELGVTDEQVPLWTPNGRLPITPAQHAVAVAALGSQTSVPLFDMIAEPAPTDFHLVASPASRRKLTAMQRTFEWLEHLVAHSRGKSNVWAPVVVDAEGDWAGQLRYVRPLVTANQVSGVVLIGWSRINDSATRQVVPNILKTEMQDATELDQPPIVAVLTTKTLFQIVEAACSGGNMIGTNLPTVWARAKKAFILDLSSWRAHKAKRARTEEAPEGAPTLQDVTDENGCVDLSLPQSPKTHSWYQDSGPLVANCTCMTCTTHSRSYVYHLVCAKELLGEILLFIHNLHHLMKLVDEMNQSLIEDRETELMDYVEEMVTGVTRN